MQDATATAGRHSPKPVTHESPPEWESAHPGPHPRCGGSPVSARPLAHTPTTPSQPAREQPVSVLICDDRADVRHTMVQHVRPPATLSAPGDTVGVADGYALLQALEANPAAAVLIAVHADSTTGHQAITLLHRRHPTAAPIIVGSPADLRLLAEVYTRGAGGLLLWEPTRAPRRAPPETPHRSADARGTELTGISDRVPRLMSSEGDRPR